jgi:polysaccharide biosynthesis transport protein
MIREDPGSTPRLPDGRRGDAEGGYRTDVNTDRHEISVNLRELLRFLLRGALLAAVLAGVLGSVVYVSTASRPPVYRAEATLLVARTQSGVGQLGLSTVTAPPIDLGAYRVALVSDTVLTAALVQMGVEEPTLGEVLALRGTAGSSTEAGVRDSSLLRVEARGPTPQVAAARANALASALVEWDRRRASDSINRVVATLEQQIAVLTEQIETLQTIGDGNGQTQIDGLVRLRAEQQQQLGYARALVASAEGLLTVLQSADSRVLHVAPRPVLSTAVAVVLGVVLAYGILLVMAALNTRLRDSDDIAHVTGLPVLAEFPSGGRLDDARSREASSYLRTNLLFATPEFHPRVFMVTSAGEHEGKTTVARYLAESFVRYGYTTLLVDADLRSPAVAAHYDVGDQMAGATTQEWLKESTGTFKVLSVDVGAEEQLHLIAQPAAIPNAPELLGRGFRSALNRWHDYDIVVIDTAPILAVSDSLTVAPHCTGTILVVDRNRTDRRKLEAAVSALVRIGVQVLGVVANKVSAVSGAAGYGSPYAAYDEGPERATNRSPIKVTSVR